MIFLKDYLLFFLLGSYTVASIDDIKRMAASRSFVHLWLLLSAIGGIFYYFSSPEELKIKLVIAAAVYIIFCTGIFKFKIAFGDYSALLPLVFILEFWELVTYLLFVLIIDLILFQPFYHFILGKSEYPFMPQITIPLFVSVLATVLNIDVLEFLINTFLHFF